MTSAGALALHAGSGVYARGLWTRPPDIPSNLMPTSPEISRMGSVRISFSGGRLMKRQRRINQVHLAKVRGLPCMACEALGMEQVTPTDAHHVRRDAEGHLYGTSQKAHDDEAIPLCWEHHWNGVVSKWSHRKFEAAFGPEHLLVEKIRQKLNWYPF